MSLQVQQGSFSNGSQLLLNVSPQSRLVHGSAMHSYLDDILDSVFPIEWLQACDASIIPVYLVLVLVHMDHNPIVVKSSYCLLVLCDPYLQSISSKAGHTNKKAWQNHEPGLWTDIEQQLEKTPPLNLQTHQLPAFQ